MLRVMYRSTGGAWLRVGCNSSAAIRLVANDLSAANQAVEMGQDVPAQAVMVEGEKMKR